MEIEIHKYLKRKGRVESKEKKIEFLLWEIGLEFEVLFLVSIRESLEITRFVRHSPIV